MASNVAAQDCYMQTEEEEHVARETFPYLPCLVQLLLRPVQLYGLRPRPLQELRSGRFRFAMLRNVRSSTAFGA
jgi:hypothetical protein